MNPRRLAIPLAIAALIVGIALPAAAGKPAPVVDATSGCVSTVSFEVPKGGKRVYVIEAGLGSHSDPAAGFLNGTSGSFEALIVPAQTVLEVVMYDKQGNVVYGQSFDVACEAPRPSAT